MVDQIPLHQILVVRRIGDLRLVVNIKTNAVFQVDELCCLYIEEAQKNSGFLNFKRLKAMTKRSQNELVSDIAALNEALQA